MQLPNNHSLLIISALAETLTNTLHTKIHRYGNILIPKFIESASESDYLKKKKQRRCLTFRSILVFSVLRMGVRERFKINH